MILKITNIVVILNLLLEYAVNLAILSTLPSLQQFIQGDIFKKYQIKELQTFTYLISPSATIIGTLEKECHSHEAYIEIHSIAQINKDDHSVNNKYFYHDKSNSLYELSQGKLSIHIIQWQNNIINEPKMYNWSQNCSKYMVTEYFQEKVFIFSCSSIYETLTDQKFNIKLTANHPHQNVYKSLIFEELIFQITLQGVVIYAVDINLNLKRVADIQRYEDNNLQTADIYYSNKRLYLLDKKLGVLIYNRIGNQFTFDIQFQLELQEDFTYSKLVSWHNTLIMAIQGQTQSFVAETQMIDTKLYLVRYFKGYSTINDIFIQQNRLVIRSQNRIDFLEINRDPRLIRHALNGYSFSHYHGIEVFQHLKDDKYLIVTSKNIKVVTLALIDRRIECDFSQTGTYNILVQQPCSTNVQFPFNHQCTRIKHIEIIVVHQDNYLWLLLIVIGAFIAVILYLMYWREVKTQQIDYILTKIRQFKLKQKEVEFQEVQQPANDLVVQNINWGQISIPKQTDNNQDFCQAQINSQRNNLT